MGTPVLLDPTLWLCGRGTRCPAAIRQAIPEASGVYVMRSTIDDRAYVGSSSNCRRRLGEHCRDLLRGKHPNPILQNFVNKHGLACLTFEVIEECVADELYAREEHYIGLLSPSLNIAQCVPSPNRGKKHRPESIEKMREFHRNYRHSAEAKRKISDALLGNQHTKGRKLSEEHKRKISEKLKGRPSPMKGRRHGEETLRRMSEAHKGQPGWFKGKKHKESSKQKIREAMKRRRLTTEHREKIRQAHARRRKARESVLV